MPETVDIARLGGERLRDGFLSSRSLLDASCARCSAERRTLNAWPSSPTIY
jgi:hypothetical protein